jgi:hypothetical protein
VPIEQFLAATALHEGGAIRDGVLLSIEEPHLVVRQRRRVARV